MQVAHFLEAPLEPAARRFWRATSAQHSNPWDALRIASQTLLSADAPPAVNTAVLQAHPLVCHSAVPLAAKLSCLPAPLHAAACQYAVHTRSDGKCCLPLLVRRLEDTATLPCVAVALPHIAALQAVSLHICCDTWHSSFGRSMGQLAQAVAHCSPQIAFELTIAPHSWCKLGAIDDAGRIHIHPNVSMGWQSIVEHGAPALQSLHAPAEALEHRPRSGNSLQAVSALRSLALSVHNDAYLPSAQWHSVCVLTHAEELPRLEHLAFECFDGHVVSARNDPARSESLANTLAALPALRSCTLHNVLHSSAGMLMRLSRLTQLTHLHLDVGTGLLLQDGAPALPPLQLSCLSGLMHLQAMVKSRSQNQGPRANVSAADAIACVTRELAYLTALTHLSMSNNGCDAALAAALAEQAALQSLALHVPHQWSATGTLQLGNAVTSCVRLEDLTLDAPAAVAELTVAATERHALVGLMRLRVSRSCASTRDVHAFAQRLRQASKLRSFAWTNSRLGGAGAVTLMAAVSGHRHLTELVLSHNRIQAAGAMAAGRALHGLPRLVRCNVSGNPLAVRGVLAMIEGAAQLRDLHVLDVGDCGADVQTLAAAKVRFAAVWLRMGGQEVPVGADVCVEGWTLGA